MTKTLPDLNMQAIQQAIAQTLSEIKQQPTSSLSSKVGQSFHLDSTNSLKETDPVTVYLRDLTISANKAAESLACGSILAGQSSEADEFGDIAIWLGAGKYGEGNEVEVLEALDLGRWADRKVVYFNFCF